MDKGNDWNDYKLESPANYRIRVQGQIDKKWSDYLSGMSISIITNEDGKKVTELIGHLEDQSALSGVLSGLYELRMPLLSVENMDEK